MARVFALSVVAFLIHRSSGQTATSTPRTTTLATTRHTIDFFNYTFNLASDEPLVSVGAYDVFDDGIGSARSTAVMFQTPVGNGERYAPVRCDMLFFKVGGQSRDLLTDFFLTLYADDESDTHNPGKQVRRGFSSSVSLSHLYSIVPTFNLAYTFQHPFLQLSAPLSLASYSAALLTYRSIWYQVSVKGTGATTDWPFLNISTNYWVVVSPGSRMTFTAPFKYNGIAWAGVDISRDAIPGQVRSDDTGGNLFTARSLNSQRFSGDSAMGANSLEGVAFVRNTRFWGSVSSSATGSVQYKNWQATGSNIRYGLQILGIQGNPTLSPTSSSEDNVSS